MKLNLDGFTPTDSGEQIRVVRFEPGATATVVAPARITDGSPVDLILYALPNGNTTAQTMGRAMAPNLDWHFDIQHIAAQTRALRTMGLPNAVVVYLEAEKLSWPTWRSAHAAEHANARIVQVVDSLRSVIGNPKEMTITLAGHSGGGSFMFGFIDGQLAIPQWIDRIVFLDATYNFDSLQHGQKLADWLDANPSHKLVSLAYDDRNIMLGGKRVVSDSGGTWRASHRMIRYLDPRYHLDSTTLGEFNRFHSKQIELLIHPNPENKILHTTMIGEMNGYMHALLTGRSGYDNGTSLLKSERAYTKWVEAK